MRAAINLAHACMTSLVNQAMVHTPSIFHRQPIADNTSSASSAEPHGQQLLSYNQSSGIMRFNTSFGEQTSTSDDRSRRHFVASAWPRRPSQPKEE